MLINIVIFNVLTFFGGEKVWVLTFFGGEKVWVLTFFGGKNVMNRLWTKKAIQRMANHLFVFFLGREGF